MNDITVAVDFSSVCAALLLVCASILILKNFGFKGTPVFACVAILSVVSSQMVRIFGIVSFFTEMSSYADVSKYASAAMKVIGIGYLGGISSDVCREMGEGGVAKCISLVSKLELVAISLPFIKEISTLSIELLGG